MFDKMIHCSFDEVQEFIPRIPKNTCEGENESIPRICVCPSIKDCLNAIPMAGRVIRWMSIAGIKPIIHAYYLYADIVLCDVSDYVADSAATREMWLLEKPIKCHRVDYEIDSVVLIDGLDALNNKHIAVRDIRLKRISYTNNLERLISSIGYPYESFKEQFPAVSFRGIAANLDYDIALKFRRR